MRKADNLPPYHAVVMKSGSLNFLEPSGPAQACYGRTLPFICFGVEINQHEARYSHYKAGQKAKSIIMFLFCGITCFFNNCIIKTV